MAITKCIECSKDVSDQAQSCPNCGIAFYTPTPVVLAQKNRGTAALLAIFLGFIGIHKFYLGRPGWGLTYLCFFWTGIPGLVGLVEAVRYVFMKEEDFQLKYS